MWARDTYYPLLLEFSFGKALDKHRFPHRMEGNLFVPMIPLASIEDEAKLDSAKKCVGEMAEDMAMEFNDKLWDACENVRKFANYANIEEAILFSRFLHKEYFALMDIVVKNASANDSFKPLYDVSINAAGDQAKQKRRELIALAVRSDAAAIEQELEGDWRNMLQSLSPSLRKALPDDEFKKYCVQQYYDALENVVKKRRRVEENRQHNVSPKIKPSEGDGSSPDVRAARESLLKRLSRNDCSDVEQEVEVLWMHERQQAPECIRSSLPSTAPQDFWIENYYAVMFRLFGGEGSTLGDSNNSRDARSSDKTMGDGDCRNKTFPA